MYATSLLQLAFRLNADYQVVKSKGARRRERIYCKALFKWLEKLITLTVQVCIFGGSITFTVIVSEFADPADIKSNPFLHKDKVRQVIAVSWLFFMLDLGVAFACSAVFAFYSKYNKTVIRLGEWASFVLEIILLAAIICLALALVAYVEAVGWVAFGVVVAFVPILLILWACT